MLANKNADTINFYTHIIKYSFTKKSVTFLVIIFTFKCTNLSRVFRLV